MNTVSSPGAPSINCLQVLVQSRSITASKCISNLARSGPRSLSPNSLDSGLQVRMSMAWKCISKLAQSQSWSASLSSLDHGLQMYLQLHLITTSKFFSTPARSRPRSISLSSLDRHFQAHLELLSSPTCSQSRHSVCRCVAIWIHRYIDENTNWIDDCDSRCSQTCRWRSQVLPGLSSALPVTLQAGRNALLGSDTPVIEASKFTLHILSDTPGGFQWQTYILLMQCNATHRLGNQ